MRVFRRLVGLSLALLLLAASAGATDVGVKFSDVPDDHWASDSVRWASHYGLISGVGGGAFGLGRNVTRAEYATMLCRLMGWPLTAPDTGSFSDNQDAGAWYFAAIETAHAHGVLPRLSGDRCGPGDAISRSEMAAMTVRALGYSALAGAVQDDCPFADVTVNAGYIALAYHMGFLHGMDRWNFSPDRLCTREQAAAVLLRVHDRLHDYITQTTGPVPEGVDAVYAESLTGSAGSIPVSPRAPLESVYGAAVKAGAGGTVALRTAPLLQTVKNGVVSEGEAITEAELAELLADAAAQTARSAQYESSYLTRREADGSTTAVWYETNEDLAEKALLCKLLGVDAVYFVKQ